MKVRNARGPVFQSFICQVDRTYLTEGEPRFSWFIGRAIMHIDKEFTGITDPYKMQYLVAQKEDLHFIHQKFAYGYPGGAVSSRGSVKSKSL